MCQRKAGGKWNTNKEYNHTVTYICLKELTHFALKVKSIAQSFSTLFHFCKNFSGSQCAFEQRFLHCFFSDLYCLCFKNFRNLCWDCDIYRTLMAIEYWVKPKSGVWVWWTGRRAGMVGHAPPHCATAALGSKQAMRRNGSCCHLGFWLNFR